MKKYLILLCFLFIGGPIMTSCSSSRGSGYCKSKGRDYKPAKCWNAEKQKYVRCH